MLLNKHIQRAKKFLREKGYGRGTNYTTNSVAYLIAQYHDESETSKQQALNIGDVVLSITKTECRRSPNGKHNYIIAPDNLNRLFCSYCYCNKKY